jgi:hypothetical protein
MVRYSPPGHAGGLALGFRSGYAPSSCAWRRTRLTLALLDGINIARYAARKPSRDGKSRKALSLYDTYFLGEDKMRRSIATVETASQQRAIWYTRVTMKASEKKEADRDGSLNVGR